jgi:oligopeptide/dipeptide ABC transporter ATP-binding protein
VAKAVDGVSFSLHEGETLGLLGESGSGKSVTCLSILRLVPSPAGKIVSGRLIFRGQDLLKLSEKQMRGFRGKSISMILQDPLTSLNPVFTIGGQLMEALKIHRPAPVSRLKELALELLRLVHIPEPETRLGSYPHQFSGGMRQRVVGAISIASEPRLLIADEPTTSLDLTIQAQFLRLLKELQTRTNLAILFITHDLGVAAKMCDRIAVMYAGRIVEEAPVRALFDDPAHPYTRGLMLSLPRLDKRVDHLSSIQGQPPTLYNLPTGCAFAPRCPEATEICHREYPPETRLGDQRRVACWLHVKERHD